ncbi:Histone-binding protein rbbp4 [Nowakowskiella sp. JEL0078]|nr:Histone-binding protein rbbp4 [Nowakowskiella sp. JEL0078]
MDEREPENDNVLLNHKLLLEEKQINEEYKVWKKNSPFLYDLVVTHALEWPSLTVEWFPDIALSDDKDHTIQRLLVGTHTSDNAHNYLQIVSLKLPTENEFSAKEDANKESSVYSNQSCNIQITQRINHDGEVNRARYMPENPNIIASRTVAGPVYIFDRSKHSNVPSDDGICKPDIRLVGLTSEGYGLEWHPRIHGKILSASEEGVVCLWDINSYTKENREIEALQSYNGHSAWVEDISWSAVHDAVFASVGDDKKLLIWDTRDNSPMTPKFTVNAHSREINCVAFHPTVEYMLATGSADKMVNLWDLRNLSRKVHVLESHMDEVLQLQWNYSKQAVLASSGADRRLMVWDLGKVGEEQSPEDAEDGPPELLFVHGGHTNKISDFAWDRNKEWTLCSVAEDNICQVWQMV